MHKDEFLKKLGKNIVRLRQKKGWSQSELARHCDKDRQAIERIENGKVNPSAYTLQIIAESLKLPVSQLLDF